MEQNKFQPKIVVIGEECKVLKPITFSRFLDKNTLRTYPIYRAVTDIGIIELIAKNCYGDNKELDLIFVIPQFKKRSEGMLYLGHWNDGILKD